MGEPEDVVDEQQHILVLNVTEILRHCQCRQGDTKPSPRGFVHLTEHQGSVLQDAGLFHLIDEVVALTGPLPHTREYGGAAEVVGDAVNHLLNEHGLTDPRATKQADLAALDVRGEQVKDLDAGLQHLGTGFQRIELGCRAVNRPAFCDLNRCWIDVQHISGHVPHMPFCDVAHRHRNRSSRVTDLRPTTHAVSGF